jgi:hypothetical protein
MPYTGKFQQTVRVDEVIYVNETTTITAEGSNGLITPITGPVTDKEIIFTLDVSQSKLFTITCTTAATIKTNNIATPDKTLTLVANGPQTWKEGDLAANHPFGTVDVTKFYVTIAATGSWELRIVSLYDTTP